MGVEIPENFCVLGLHNFTLPTEQNVRPTDLVLNYMALANSFVVFPRGVPQKLGAFGLIYVRDEAGKKKFSSVLTE